MAKNINPGAQSIVKPTLRPLAMSDRSKVCTWMTSPYILQHSFVIPGPNHVPSDFGTLDYAARYFETLMHDRNRITFTIEIDKTSVGSIGLKSISLSQKYAECFIEIGEPSMRGKGIGHAAMKELLARAFYILGLQRVDLEVLEFNFPALKIYHRLGFNAVGTSDWHFDEFGQYWRVLRMSITKSSWQQHNQNAS